MSGSVREYKREFSTYSDAPLCSPSIEEKDTKFDVLKECADDDVSDDERVGRTCVICCKKFCAFLLSHIGLCALVVGYSIAGGFIFRALEAPHEIVERQSVTSLRKHHVQRLWNITQDCNRLHEENWTERVGEVLQSFETQLYIAIKEKGWDGIDSGEVRKWSYTGALLYSITVITTIGYGHITPKTTYGRLVTIFYAMVGIPLTLLCLTKVGALFGSWFRFFYKHLCRFLAAVFLPKQSKTRRKNSSTYNNQVERSNSSRNSIRSAITSYATAKKDTSEKPVRVPIILSIMIIAGYVFGGAVLFSEWEENWDYLIGSYFCFITLSTIGFGDFVPGTSLHSWSDQHKAMFCALYLVFGLALIAMCFDLMQEEVKAKFQWLGLKLRLLDKRQKR